MTLPQRAAVRKLLKHTAGQDRVEVAVEGRSAGTRSLWTRPSLASVARGLFSVGVFGPHLEEFSFSPVDKAWPGKSIVNSESCCSR